MNHPAFTRPLDPTEDARAQALYDDLNAGIAPFESPLDVLPFERVRILDEQGGLNWSDPAHLRALGVASGEDEVYLVNPRNPACPRVAVSLPALTAFVAENDLLDVDVFDRVSAGWDEGVLDLLAPAFVDQWTLVSTTGSWIFSAWNAGDLSVLGGSKDFIAAYAAAHPAAPSAVIEWLIAEGETAASDEPDLAIVAGLRKNITHDEFIFEASALREYLLRFYDEDSVGYLWSTTEQIFRTDVRRGMNDDERNFPTYAGPPAPRVSGAEVTEFLDSTMVTVGSADERLTRLMSHDSGIHSRLEAIWSGRPDGSAA